MKLPLVTSQFVKYTSHTVHIISKSCLRDFWEEHPRAEGPLDAWHKVAQKAEWQSFQEIKATYPTVDRVGKFTVFDIGGNKWRLITAIHYNRQIIFVRAVLTHEEYDRDRWKEN